jgi:cytochrome c
MFTITRKAKWLGLCAFAAAAAAGCAAQHARDVPEAGYSGGPLNFGTTPDAADMSRYYAYPADGRGLPAGSGTYAQGKQVYTAKCMACHGDKLQGVPGMGDILIGGRGSLVNNSTTKAPFKTIESYWPYATTIFDYVKRAMPFNAPGSLSDNEVYAVTAYILGEAKIISTNEVINARTLPKVEMPNRDGFTPVDPRPDVKTGN